MIDHTWLARFAPGYVDLSDEERAAIEEFTLLWTLFEAKALQENASARAIGEAVTRWHAADQIHDGIFAAELAYFRGRYFKNGAETYRFAHLHLRANDQPALVTDVLRGDRSDPQSVATALLIVVFRYRNNYFHGLKWAYEMREQLDNFGAANAVLRRCIEMQQRGP